MEGGVEEEILKRVLEKVNPRNVFKFNKDFKLFGLDNEYLQVYTMLENTFKYREGKSCMIIGPRGSSKTTLVNKCLWELQKKNYEFFTIRINGSLHTDDKTAIKEIAKQLDFYLQGYNQDTRRRKLRATFEQTSINATMNVIVNILDKTRLSEKDDLQETIVDENGFVIQQRKQLMPIVFVIDHIDVYAQHSKQTLLYNLFDMAQSSSTKTGGETSGDKGTAISVIGLTTKTTVREQLEKRVKSRFSQRIIQLNKVRTLDGFLEAVYCMLSLCDNDGNDRNVAQYNMKLKAVINCKTGEFRKMIVRNFYTVRDLNGLKNELLPYIMNINESYDSMGDYKSKNLVMLTSLSEIELKILICCSRVKIKSNVTVVNFDLVREEYNEMLDLDRREIQSRLETVGVSLKTDQYKRSQPALKTAWERLLSLGILSQVVNKSQLTRLVESSLEIDEIISFCKQSRDPWILRWSKF